MDFISFMTVNRIKPGREKIKYYFSIHELIVRNLGTIQLQFSRGWGWGWIRYKSLFGDRQLRCELVYTQTIGTGVGKQINLI